MAKSNYDKIGEALMLLTEGLVPFVRRELEAWLGKNWETRLSEFASGPILRNDPNWDDIHFVLTVMWDTWHPVFKNTLGHSERSLVSELKEARNKWAHKVAVTTDDTYRTLDSMERLLTAISAPQAETISKRKEELLRLKFEEQRRAESRKTTTTLVEGRPVGTLKPWREVVTPHPDVCTGNFQNAEFAADLWQVYRGEAKAEYRHPGEFFRRTYLTEGISSLLVGAAKRLSGEGGDPVVELQTNFGGGKTHTMLALYHLFSCESALELAGVDELYAKNEVKHPGQVRKAIVVGTRISPGMLHKKEDGTVVRTLWGEIAWQLGGKEGYEMLREADETSTSPGDMLRELFDRYSPCLVLIDEWVAYARMLHDTPGLPSGTFETQFTFAQTLTEAAKSANKTLVVISVPASDVISPHQQPGTTTDTEVGGERGKMALVRLKNAIGRIESTWRPANQNESFEIVKRRLFQPLTDNKLAVIKDSVARAFVEMYGAQHQEFPSECREVSYERAILACYPIHPELFDRLYNDWSTLPKFQRTRGVLRLMAAVINHLWEGGDASLLIMPASVPISDGRVRDEITRNLEDSWSPIIDKDIDGPGSLPLEIDKEFPNFGKLSACRRVARTIFMGSAPMQKTSNRGIDDRQIKLGCVQPGENTAPFGDALRRLADRATYLYPESGRYWYGTQPSVTRLADDRASQIKDPAVEEEIRKWLLNHARSKGSFAKVHVAPTASDLPDDRDSKLVILGPEFSHTSRSKGGPALTEARALFEKRGTLPREYRNTVVFLTPDENRISELRTAVRQYLAWDSICTESESLNLDANQKRHATTRRETAHSTVEARIPEAYCWLLTPTQPDPKGALDWQESRLSSREPLAERASKRLVSDEQLFVSMAGTRLRLELDRVPLWRGDHVGVKLLAEDFARYCYLPRLKTEQVLLDAISDGVKRLSWTTDTFAYADSYDADNKRFVGLQAGVSAIVRSDDHSVVVKASVADRQMKAEQKKPDTPTTAPTAPGEVPPFTLDGDGTHEPAQPAAPKPISRFFGTVSVDPVRITRDMSDISNEVLQHLLKLPNSKVEITIEISAHVPNGVPDDVVRTVIENARTLRFRSQEFERE